MKLARHGPQRISGAAEMQYASNKSTTTGRTTVVKLVRGVGGRGPTLLCAEPEPPKCSTQAIKVQIDRVTASRWPRQ